MTINCRAGVFLTFLLGLILSRASGADDERAGSDGTAGGGPPAGVDGDWSPQREEFLRVAERLHNGRNPFLGYRQIEDLRARLADPDSAGSALVMTHRSLASELARTGDVEGAVEEINQATRLVAADPSLSSLLPAVLWTRAIVFLRKAEVANCIARHNADCCIFPLRGGGVHEDAQPARDAAKSLMYFLDLEPLDLRARWLLNLVHMAIGDYPDGVTPIYRISPDVFRSEYDIGRFVDIAPRLGLDVFNLAGGSIADDFDGDGFLDLVTSTWDPAGPMTCHHNTGDGRFEDCAAATRLDDQLGAFNIVGGDYDNDGDLDILGLRGGWLFDDGRLRNSLLRRNADGTFTDVTRAAGVAEPACPTQTAAWGDYDNDGDLDLYVGNESRIDRRDLAVPLAATRSAVGNESRTDRVDPEADYPCQLYRNNGDGTFTDVASAAGVTNDRFCKGVAAGDYDNDGDLDLYVSNIGENRLYRNQGDGTFTDVAKELGVTEPAGRSFACWSFDYDNDGWLDIFVGAYDALVEDVAADYLGLPFRASPPRLYRNNGDGTFKDVTKAAGLHHAWLPMGANFGDLDHDGFLDMYLTTGDPDYHTLMPNIMLRNDAGRRFQDVTSSGGFGHLQKGHGVAFADFDNDGDQDVFNQLGGFFPGDKFKSVLYLNPGHGHRYLYVQLVGTRSNRGGLGARIKVTVETPAGVREIHRAVGMVSSFGGSPLRQEIGLSNATAIRSLEVWWPTSNLRQSFTGVPLDSMVRITEGQPTAEPIPLRSVRFLP